MTLHIGFTGTRHGMTFMQDAAVLRLVDDLHAEHDLTVHHGCCVGADADFHSMCRDLDLVIVGHPGPDYPTGELCARGLTFDALREPMPHMKRNAAIVAASQIMIAAPLEMAEQKRGGTWATIRMALKAIRSGTLRTLYIVGRDGVIDRRAST